MGQQRDDASAVLQKCELHAHSKGDHRSCTKQAYRANRKQELRIKGFSDQEILDRVFQENLFQYPTEREIKSKCRACLKRLDSMADIPFAIEALANSAIGEAKQAALVALMCQSLLMQDFMINVIGEKYRRLDMTLTRRDMNLFFDRLAEQDDNVASWSDQTIEKLKAVIRACLRETEYDSQPPPPIGIFIAFTNYL